MNLAALIHEAIGAHRLVPDDTNVVVGVSGGADSVALAHALHQLGIPFTVAHLNHNLRGAESDADEQFVRGLGFPTVVKSVDVEKRAEAEGISIEMAARQARHEFFGEFDNAVIALAHHADDQVETFFLKLARGAGTEGLGGMGFSQQIGQLRLIRPMLDIPRPAIMEWLAENNIAWREDASNTDEAYLRNRVRHKILPLLEQELNPNLREAVLRTMDILREEQDWMDELIAGCRLPTAGFPKAGRRRVLRKWLFGNGADDVSYGAVDSILSLMDAGKGSTIFELNDRQRVVVEYGIPRFESTDAEKSGRNWKLTAEAGKGWRKDHGQGVGTLPAEASFNATKVGDSPIEVRRWQAGDRMEPLGMDGSRKLQDILTDQKVPKAQRNEIPVVVCRGEIIWMPGYRIARGWEVDGENGKAVHVRIEQNRTD